MRPELFRLFDVSFPAYFVLLLTGFLFATGMGVLWARRIGQNPDVIVDLGLAMLLSGVAGARLLHVFADGYFWDYVHLCTDPSRVRWPLEKAECVSPAVGGIWDAAQGACHPATADCFAWAKFWAGGLTYYGGLVLASATAWFVLRRDGFPFWKAADMAGFAVPVGLAFGRMGCFLAGCCFGAPTEGPFGVSFPPRSPASDMQHRLGLLVTERSWSLPVHPTQIYEAAYCLVLASVLFWGVHPRKRYDGQVFAAFLALYAVGRCALEMLRQDDRGGIGFLTTSQWIGLALLGAAGLLHSLRQSSAKMVPLPTP